MEAAAGQAGRPSEIEVDAIELVPFAAVTGEDVRRASEPDRETLRQRAAHAGPIDEDTLVYLTWISGTGVCPPWGEVDGVLCGSLPGLGAFGWLR
ncbi:MAG: hypothetical protein WBP81_00495 [Solirubrobacteraceae bacterium]